jgi:nucleotide-binding universal stress UspA family protein
VRYSTELGFALPDLKEDLEKASRAELERLITDDDRRTLNVVPVVETHVNVARGITGYARDHDIDLIIVGTHGRGAVTQFLMGSAAERVVRTAPCPVLAVRPNERDFIKEDALVAVAKA